MVRENLMWSDRKRIWCGLPWTFTVYGLSEDRFFVQSGLLRTQEHEVRLYRIMNINLQRGLIQKIFGLGTIHIDSSDKDLGSFDIKNVKNSYDIKELISEAVEKERQRNRVATREYMSGGDFMDDGIDDDM